MQSYLVFTLSASFGAMGDLAGHERRGSLSWPGRSSVLGLLAAALGKPRYDDFSALDALSIAVAVFDHGVSLRDYHTVETVPSSAVKNANSRPEALDRATNTTITLRDYRAGVLYGVAVWDDDFLILEALKGALENPKFILYLGRKSCPLSYPPSPKILKADGPEKALEALNLPLWRQKNHQGGPMEARDLMADAGSEDVHIETRHDKPLDRKLWHFAPRQVAFRTVKIVPNGKEQVA